MTRQRKKARTTTAHTTTDGRRPRPDAAPAVHALPASPAKAIVQDLRGIPLHLVKYIFNEQMGAMGDLYYANPIPYAPTCISKAMPELARVSRGWRKVFLQITREFEAANGFFSFKDGSEDKVEAFYSYMEQRGPQLINLQLSLSYGLGYPRLTFPQRFAILDRVDALEIDWDRALRHCPKLLRLDLWAMLLHGTQLGKVLVAASTHCPQVQALILPLTELPILNQTKLQPNFALLYSAMKRWYKGSLNRGLLQLTVPHRVDPSDGHDLRIMRYTDEYLNAIAEYCPNLEYLDGGRVTNRTLFHNYSEEMLFCSLETWKNFCKSCTKLRMFDWFCAPLDDRFLEIFGKYRKPQLTRMILACGNEDRWEFEWHSGKYLDPKGEEGFRFSAKALGVMLSACPALTSVHIQISNLSRRLEEVKRELNDDFLVALAQHCKRLTSLAVEQFQAKERANKPTSRMGDKGLLALASLHHLCEVRSLDVTQATVQGVFDLLVKAPNAACDRRDLTLHFGERPREDDTHDGAFFFGLVSNLLEKLMSLPDTLHRCSFNVKLTIPYTFTVENHDVVRKELETCAHQFTQRFPLCLLRFASSWWPLGQKHVPDDLTEIYYVWIDTEGYKRWKSLS